MVEDVGVVVDPRAAAAEDHQRADPDRRQRRPEPGLRDAQPDPPPGLVPAHPEEQRPHHEQHREGGPIEPEPAEAQGIGPVAVHVRIHQPRGFGKPQERVLDTELSHHVHQDETDGQDEVAGVLVVDQHVHEQSAGSERDVGWQPVHEEPDHVDSRLEPEIAGAGLDGEAAQQDDGLHQRQRSRERAQLGAEGNPIGHRQRVGDRRQAPVPIPPDQFARVHDDRQNEHREQVVDALDDHVGHRPRGRVVHLADRPEADDQREQCAQQHGDEEVDVEHRAGELDPGQAPPLAERRGTVEPAAYPRDRPGRRRRGLGSGGLRCRLVAPPADRRIDTEPRDREAEHQEPEPAPEHSVPEVDPGQGDEVRVPLVDGPVLCRALHGGRDAERVEQPRQRAGGQASRQRQGEHVRHHKERARRVDRQPLTPPGRQPEEERPADEQVGEHGDEIRLEVRGQPYRAERRGIRVGPEPAGQQPQSHAEEHGEHCRHACDEAAEQHGRWADRAGEDERADVALVVSISRVAHHPGGDQQPREVEERDDQEQRHRRVGMDLAPAGACQADSAAGEVAGLGEERPQADAERHREARVDGRPAKVPAQFEAEKLPEHQLPQAAWPRTAAK